MYDLVNKARSIFNYMYVTGLAKGDFLCASDFEMD